MKEKREIEVLKIVSSDITEQELSDWLDLQSDKGEIEEFLVDTVSLFKTSK